MENIASSIDHTLLKPMAIESDIKKLCQEAKENKFAAVCVNPTHVPLAKYELRSSPVKVCTVIGFPLGANTSESKALETMNAINNGADEIDMVINIGALKDRNYEFVKNDISAVVFAAAGKTVKVILETCLLTDEEITKACECAKGANANFVKTSTGFSTEGATLNAVETMKKAVGDSMKIKASGGIRDRDTALKYLEAGASRLGTSSGVQILQGSTGSDQY